MWEIALFEEKLTGDLGNTIEAALIRWESVKFFREGKGAPGN